MTDPDTLPDPDAFREWLRQALVALQLKPSGYGVKLGLGRNTLTHFLGSPGRDLTLGVASRIVPDIRARAAAAGVEVPALPRLSAELAPEVE